MRGRRVVAVELGAGLAIPTVRRECEHRAGVLIRINPREADTPPGGIALPFGARAALALIDGVLGEDPGGAAGPGAAPEAGRGIG